MSAAGNDQRIPGVRAKKSLGQHFLTDAAITEKIADFADPSPDEVIIEVGPGTGVLTRALARRFGLVIAVEIDSHLASLLQTEFDEDSNVRTVTGDVRDFSPEDLLRDNGRDLVRDGGAYKLAGNLPYYVASPIIRHFLESDHKPVKMVVTVQREVGENMVAGPGKTGLLSLSVQVYGAPIIVAHIPASKFRPKPKVDSVVVAIDVHAEPLVSDPERFFKVAKAGFRAPRKQLHNSLVKGLGGEGEVVREALDRVGIDGRRRPSTLTIEEWDMLAKELA